MPSWTKPVDSRPLWVDTGVDAQPGQPLTFAAAGQWRDWFIDCGPEGYERLYLAPLAWLRRVPRAPWFCLCVALDQDLASAVAVGAGATHAFARAGRIFAFANDAPFAYGNNSGAVELTIDA